MFLEGKWAFQEKAMWGWQWLGGRLTVREYMTGRSFFLRMIMSLRIDWW